MKKYSFTAGVLAAVFLIAATTSAFQVPAFVKSVPPKHYAGVSSPSKTLQGARNEAVSDVVKQVLGSIAPEYKHAYESRISGNIKKPTWHVRDDFSRVASGVVMDIERNIIKTKYIKDRTDKDVCFILVKYPRAKIREMRRLSKGAMLVVSVVSVSKGKLKLKISETNGVKVTIGSAHMHVTKKNTLAGFFNFCIWKVSYGSEDFFSIALDPVKLCSSSSIVKLDITKAQKSFKDYLLGADLDYKIKIKGFDELGRPVVARTEF